MSRRDPAGSAANLKVYFAQYPGFKYNASKPATSEFRRLCTFLDQRDGKAPRDAELQAFANSLGSQFGEKYGVEINDTEAWQKLCRRLGINPVPQNIQAAQQAVRATHFNMVDIIDDGPDGRIQTFPTRKALKVYSFRSKKGFPQQCSTAGPIMASLLNTSTPVATATRTAGDITVEPVKATSSSLQSHVDARPPPVELREEVDSPAASTVVSTSPPYCRGTTRSIPPSTEQRFTLPRLGLASDRVESPPPARALDLPLAQFFAPYQAIGFRYNPETLPLLEYQRLQRIPSVSRPGPMRDSMFDTFARAMVDEFSAKFGASTDDLAAWQRLCKRIGIDPIPATLYHARAEFKKTHVNLVELMMIDSIPDGEMEKFDTEEELAAYTRSKPGRTFPRKEVEKGSLLEHLLRRIWEGHNRIY